MFPHVDWSKLVIYSAVSLFHMVFLSMGTRVNRIQSKVYDTSTVFEDQIALPAVNSIYIIVKGHDLIPGRVIW